MDEIDVNLWEIQKLLYFDSMLHELRGLSSFIKCSFLRLLHHLCFLQKMDEQMNIQGCTWTFPPKNPREVGFLILFVTCKTPSERVNPSFGG